eukprot:scaffold222756_cov40-Prasinocladus_malaysianus.AAC.1
MASSGNVSMPFPLFEAKDDKSFIDLKYEESQNEISVSAHRKSDVARHSAAGLPAMDAKATHDCVVKFL